MHLGKGTPRPLEAAILWPLLKLRSYLLKSSRRMLVEHDVEKIATVVVKEPETNGNMAGTPVMVVEAAQVDEARCYVRRYVAGEDISAGDVICVAGEDIATGNLVVVPLFRPIKAELSR